MLLVDGSPRFEYRFLRNMLGRDKTIELHTLLQDADIDTTTEWQHVLRTPTRNSADTERGLTQVFPVAAKILRPTTW